MCNVVCILLLCDIIKKRNSLEIFNHNIDCFINDLLHWTWEFMEH